MVDQSDASHVVKTLAKEDAVPPPGQQEDAAPLPGPAAAAPASATKSGDGTQETPDSVSGSGSTSRSTSPSQHGPPGRGRPKTVEGGLDVQETAVERRRRLAVLTSVDGEDGTNETPAERRRREAALGMSSQAPDDDSDDDDTPRVPPARRGIRFADAPDRREA